MEINKAIIKAVIKIIMKGDSNKELSNKELSEFEKFAILNEIK